MLAQTRRIALAGQNAVNDRHAGAASDVADHLGELDVHQLQRLLHVLDGSSCVGHPAVPLPDIAAQRDDLRLRNEGLLLDTRTDGQTLALTASGRCTVPASAKAIGWG